MNTISFPKYGLKRESGQSTIKAARRILFLTAILTATLLLGVGIGLGYVLNSMNRLVNGTAASPAYQLIFRRQAGPDIPTWQAIADGAQNDEEILSRAVDYYDVNAERLSSLWQEESPARLAGIYAMYLTHISQPYGETDFPDSLTEFLEADHAHCGTFTYAQYHLADSLGLTWRVVESENEHAWLEVMVDGEWEIFDATSNTWLSESGFELLEQAPREYRYFYAPVLDINRPDVREQTLYDFNLQAFRQRITGLGLYADLLSPPQITLTSENFTPATAPS